MKRQWLALLGALAIGFDKDDPRLLPTSFLQLRQASAVPFRFVVAVVDTAVHRECLAVARSAAEHQVLLAVLVDESHSVLTQVGFRPLLHDLMLYRAFGVPFVFISATLPPPMVSSLYTLYGLLETTTVQVIEQPTFSNLIVDACRVDQRTIEDLLQLAANTVMKWVERTPTGNVIIFALTKDAATAGVRQVKAADADYGWFEWVVAVTSETSEDDQRVVLERMASNKRVCVVATSVWAEGVDPSNVGLVVLAGGSHSGKLGLLQAGKRGGRGAAAGFSRVVLLRAPWLEVRDLDQREEDALVGIPDAHRAEARRLLTCEHLEGLLSTECGIVALSRSFGVQDQPPCGQCRVCAPGATWLFHDCINHVAQARVRTAPRQVPASAVPMRAVPAAILPRSIGPVQSAMYFEVMQFLKSFDAGRCISIGCTDKKPHYPNFCSSHTGNPSLLGGLAYVRGKTWCRNCFQGDHQVRQVTNLIEGPLKGKKEEQYKHELVSACFVLITDCEAWRSLKPCVRCFLAHPDTEDCRGNTTEGSACPRGINVRSALLMCFNRRELRARVLGMLSSTEAAEVGRSFTTMLRWTLYSGDASGLQNAYRVLSVYRAAHMEHHPLPKA